MVDYYERRAINPALEVVCSCARALGVPVVELLGHEAAVPLRRKSGPVSQLERRFERVKQLPRGEQEFWHGSPGPGNAASSTGAVPFLARCLAKVPKRIARARIRIRADSGFFARRIIEFLDSIGCGSVIVAKESSTIKSQARGCRFKKLGNGWEVGEFRYQPHRWKYPHRFVVVRRPIPEDPIEAKQLTLFKDRKYAYHVLVTNLTRISHR